ncbi:MAG: aldo/keto reductase [Deltaproteobacteria bacterium]|jgi:predicted aldo/keto reductase-like oxidoreductase|nr:aldo/keto reductase [Deltaproteobacteria bacterium]
MTSFPENSLRFESGKNNLTHRINPRNGDRISLLGFGAMRLPMLPGAPLPSGPEVDEAAAMALMDRAYQEGVNYFDTAWPYHQGVSEVVVGKTLKKYPRNSFNLTDKMPSFLNPDRKKAEEIFQTQLERCRTEYFDYYLCHSLMSRENFVNVYERDGVLDFLMEQKKQGRIRNLGWSFHGDMETLDYVLGCGADWDVGQLQLNYHDVLHRYVPNIWNTQFLTREAAQPARALERLAEAKIPVIVMEPLLGGRLGGQTRRAAEILRAARPEASVAFWAFRFAAGLPNVLCVLSGMNQVGHLGDNLHSYSPYEPLTDEDKAVLQKSLDVFVSQEHVPCTGCGYCVPCPADINIPGVFKLYNRAVDDDYVPPAARPRERERDFGPAYDRELGEIGKSADCLKCGACQDHCPQGIAVPDRMDQIRTFAEKLNILSK